MAKSPPMLIIEFGWASKESEKNIDTLVDLAKRNKDIGLYARITIPLDKPKQRINCNTLYELELRKKRLEVLKLQEELNALRRLNSQPVEEQFEN